MLRALLPGPYTFVVGTTVERPHLVGTEDSLGVRVPAHAPLLALLDALGTPLAASSANLSGRPDAAIAADVDPVLLAHCVAAVDHGEASAAVTGAATAASPSGAAFAATGAPSAAASTVVDLRPLGAGEPPVVLRVGAVPTHVVLVRIATALAADSRPRRTHLLFLAGPSSKEGLCATQ